MANLPDNSILDICIPVGFTNVLGGQARAAAHPRRQSADFVRVESLSDDRATTRRVGELRGRLPIGCAGWTVFKGGLTALIQDRRLVGGCERKVAGREKSSRLRRIEAK